MTKETHKLSPVVQEAVKMGMKLGQPTVTDAQTEMSQHLDRVMAPKTPEAPKPKKMSGARKLGLGVVAAAGLAAGAAGLVNLAGGENNTPTVNAPGIEDVPTSGEGETGQYLIQPGDSIDGIARKIERNVDDEASNQNYLPVKQDLLEQLDSPTAPLQPGTALEVTVNADEDPSQEGIQLEKPDPNEPKPQLGSGTSVTRG